MNEHITIVVTSIFNNDQGEIFLAKRSGKKFNNMWGLTGGKAEYGESLAQANQREHKEELGVTLDNMEFFKFYEFFDPGHALVFCYQGRLDEKVTLNPNELSEYAWFNKDAVKGLPLAPNHAILIEDYFKNKIFS